MVAWKNVTGLTWDSGTHVATVAVANDFSTDDWVSVQGADQPEFNGWFQIVSANSTGFTFALSSASVTSATGTIRVHRMGDQTRSTYDRLGRVTTTTDQNNTSLLGTLQRGVTHTYTYGADGTWAAGKVTLDSATIPAASTGVDRNVLSIGTEYDDVGRVKTVTSYSDSEGTTPVNQVELVYNGWGQVYQEYQEHQGEVDGSTPYVQYDYAGPEDGLRLESIEYPNGRTVDYNYTDAVDDIMSRFTNITTDGESTPNASYTYLGAGTIVKEDYQEPDVALDYTGANNAFPGFDRFGRVVDQLWRDYGASEDADRYLYGYDRSGNRVWKENATPGSPNLDELYTYDAVNRLTDMERGNLIAGSYYGKQIENATHTQSWDVLDALGNWSSFTDDSTTQTRTHDAANQITSASNWATPQYDAAGSMTTVPAPTESSSMHALWCKYDAWNHLVEVREGSSSGSLVAQYRYDATGRRIESLTDFGSGTTPGSVTHYYLSGQQVVETRDTTSETAVPGTSDVKYQYVWSPRYIDAPICRDEYSSGELQSDSRLFYLSDANHNVTALVGKVSGNWQVVERYVYDTYGQVTIYTPGWTAQQSPTVYNNTVLYTGRVLDGESGLYYYRARFYNVELGVFTSRDPLEADLNLYRYCGNEPTQATDPSGEIIVVPKPRQVISGWKDTGIRVGTGKVLGQDWLPDGHQFIQLSDGSKVGFYPDFGQGTVVPIIKSLAWTPGIVGPDGEPGDKVYPVLVDPCVYDIDKYRELVDAWVKQDVKDYGVNSNQRRSYNSYVNNCNEWVGHALGTWSVGYGPDVTQAYLPSLHWWDRPVLPGYGIAVDWDHPVD